MTCIEYTAEKFEGNIDNAFKALVAIAPKLSSEIRAVRVQARKELADTIGVCDSKDCVE